MGRKKNREELASDLRDHIMDKCPTGACLLLFEASLREERMGDSFLLPVCLGCQEKEKEYDNTNV